MGKVSQARSAPPQVPVQLGAQRIGLPRALGAIMVAWGVTALSFAGGDLLVVLATLQND